MPLADIRGLMKTFILLETAGKASLLEETVHSSLCEDLEAGEDSISVEWTPFWRGFHEVDLTVALHFSTGEWELKNVQATMPIAFVNLRQRIAEIMLELPEAIQTIDVWMQPIVGGRAVAIERHLIVR